MVFRKLSFIVGSFSLIFSCVKEVEVKKEVAVDRQAPARIEDSLRTQDHSLTIKKDSLGKTFLIVPSMKSNNRMPTWKGLSPFLVTFEKSGSQLGLFLLDHESLYKTISSDHLLQSFQILSESKDELKFDFSEGFKSFVSNSELSVVDPEFLKEIIENKTQGYEEAVQVKSSFVRSIKEENNSIKVEQISRISQEDIEQRAIPFSDDTEEKPHLRQQESSFTLNVEIRPYIENSHFVKKSMDLEYRVGFFNKLVFNQDKELPSALISKWDLSANGTPVTVAITKNTPVEVIPAIQSGVEYWNRILGFKAFEFVTGYEADQATPDRTILIRWIPWTDAGFASANFQADPLTGEITRGEIFMTSSWYKHSYDSLLVPRTMDLPPGVGSACVHRQEALGLISGSNPENRKKISLDTIRIVIAHEMGHVLGLRHNFTASANFAGTDKELYESQKTYPTSLASTGYPASSSVMDYLPTLLTALTGAYIEKGILPYDQSAIRWAYLDEPLKIEKYTYCSDEHILRVQQDKKSIYACNRGDGYKNPLRGLILSLRLKHFNLASGALAETLATLSKDQPYLDKKDIYTNPSFHFDIDALKEAVYVSSQSSDTKLISVATAIKTYINSLKNLPWVQLPLQFSDSQKYSEILARDSAEIGGLSAIIKSFLPADIDNGFLKKQIEDLYTELEKNPLDGLTPEDLKRFKEDSLEAAKSFDQNLSEKILAQFLPTFIKYDYSPVRGVPFKTSDLKKSLWTYNRSLNLGDIPELFALFRKAYVRRGAAQDISFQGKKITLRPLEASSYQKNLLVKAFIKDNWGSKAYDISRELDQEIDLLKKEILSNSLTLLKAAGNPYLQNLSAGTVEAQLRLIDWSKAGFSMTDSLITSELDSLRYFEGLKKETLE